MVAGFMAGVTLGQKLVGMSSKKSKVSTRAQRLQVAKLAAYRRMKARQIAISRQRIESTTAAEDLAFDKAFNYEFKDEASGQLLNSVRNTVKDFNSWIKRQTGGLLDLNMSMAIFLIIRGIRKFLIEKQYPSAWQLIWWASSIMRGWRLI